MWVANEANMGYKWGLNEELFCVLLCTVWANDWA